MRSAPPPARRAPRRGPRTAAPCRRRSGRSRGPCRRRAAHRRAPSMRDAGARSPRPGRRSRARRARRPGSRRGWRPGFSLRGLSSVTMTTSAFSTAMRAHDRPLALVAVAAAAEHADELAGGERAQRVERGGQRLGLVRVVDDGEAAARFADDLEPALDALAGLAAPAARGRRPRPSRWRGRRRPARSRPGSRRAAAGGCRTRWPVVRDATGAARSRRAPAARASALRRARPTVSTRRPRASRGRDHCARALGPSALTTAVPSARQQLGEQPQLGGEIGLDGRVIVEMIAAEVGEGGGLQPHAVEPVLVEAVRGGFEGQVRDALGGQLRQRLVQGDGVGRGQRAVDARRRGLTRPMVPSEAAACARARRRSGA